MLLTNAPSSFAGPESISAKDKQPIVEVPTTCTHRFYVSVSSGTEYEPGNDFSNGVRDVTPLTLPGIGVVGTSDLLVRSRQYSDVYKDWRDINLELGFAITSHLDVFGRFTYTSADSQNLIGSHLAIGFAGLPPAFALGFPVTSKFDNYESWGGELGFRYYFTSQEARIRPFVALSGGARWVDAIGLIAKSDFLNADFNVYDGPFYDSTVVFTGTATLGTEYQVIPCRFAVGAEISVRYTSSLDQNDSGFAAGRGTSGISTFIQGFGAPPAFGNAVEDFYLMRLRGLNDNGAERVSIPVTFYAKLRF
jgi:hypothetical protein